MSKNNQLSLKIINYFHFCGLNMSREKKKQIITIIIFHIAIIKLSLL